MFFSALFVCGFVCVGVCKVRALPAKKNIAPATELVSRLVS